MILNPIGIVQVKIRSTENEFEYLAQMINSQKDFLYKIDNDENRLRLKQLQNNIDWQSGVCLNEAKGDLKKAQMLVMIELAKLNWYKWSIKDEK